MKMKHIYIAMFSVLVGTTGCKKEFLNVNTNPNSLPSATPGYVLANALNVSAASLVGPNELGKIGRAHV